MCPSTVTPKTASPAGVLWRVCLPGSQSYSACWRLLASECVSALAYFCAHGHACVWPTLFCLLVRCRILSGVDDC